MRTWAVVVLGFVAATTATPQLDCACTREYMPVCGSDGVTYPNTCVFRCAAKSNSDLRVVAEGECTHRFEADVACVCTLDYRPVCGSDGVTYPNLCNYNCHARQNDDLKIVANGECQTAMLKKVGHPVCACTREYNPMCGTDGVTYANPCLLKCQTKADNSLTIAHAGECKKEEVKRPICACTREYFPLCGSDGVTYNNLCLLKCQQKVQNSLTVASMGRCEDIQLAALTGQVCPCTREYNPVCGSDGKTYNNGCLLKCQQKVQPELSAIRAGRCETIPMAKSGKVCPCPLIFRPVCGTDGNTYDNQCALECQVKNGNSNLKVFHQGACIMPFAKAGGICACNRLYLPVCGTDGVTYNNPCLIGCQQKENADLTIAHYGRCAEEFTQLAVSSACRCPRIYKPVCGTDGITYNNECLLNCQKTTVNADLKVFHEGMCIMPVASATDVCICNRMYMPVCGTNGVTYDNPCLLKCQQKSNSDLKIQHYGRCSQDLIQTKEAVCPCPFIYRPVCGTDGVTYDNECILNCKAKNVNHNLKVFHQGFCAVPIAQAAAEDLCVCTDDYRPVCGSDLKTYANKCGFECQHKKQNGLTILYEGECKPQAAEDVCICPRMYMPVCGTDGQTYDNMCIMECAQKHNPGLKVQHEDEC